MIYFEITLIWAIAVFVVLRGNHRAHKKVTPEVLKPYESYTLMKETEMQWRDKR